MTTRSGGLLHHYAALNRSPAPKVARGWRVASFSTSALTAKPVVFGVPHDTQLIAGVECWPTPTVVA
jgi:hypothetical protein